MTIHYYDSTIVAKELFPSQNPELFGKFTSQEKRKIALTISAMTLLFIGSIGWFILSQKYLCKGLNTVEEIKQKLRAN